MSNMFAAKDMIFHSEFNSTAVEHVDIVCRRRTEWRRFTMLQTFPVRVSLNVINASSMCVSPNRCL